MKAKIRFRTIKMGFGELSTGHALLTLEEVHQEIHNFSGWNSIESLYKSIDSWAAQARPGDIFSTRVTAIVAAKST